MQDQGEASQAATTALDPHGQFSAIFARRLPDDFKDASGRESLVAVIDEMYRFVNDRGNQELAVRVSVPTMDSHGYDSETAVVDIVIDDSPFLVDSVTAVFEEAGYSVEWDARAVIGTVRDGDGNLLEVTKARDAEHTESVQHYVLDEAPSISEQRDLEAAISRVLGDVRLAVRDFHKMEDAVDRMIQIAKGASARYSYDDISVAVRFLEWMRDLNFVFLGYREYKIIDTDAGKALVVAPETGLGILSKPGQSKYEEPVLLSDLPQPVRERYESGFLCVIAKTNGVSTVHRRARMDYVGVRHIDEAGEVVGEARMVGLFTSRALMTESAAIPILAEKLQDVMDAEDLIKGSHDHKAVIQVFNSFPKDELFSVPVEDLRKTIHGLLATERKEQVRLFVRPDLLARSVSVMVVLPRDRFNARLRKDLQALFKERFGGSAVDYQLALGEAGSARIHFTVWIDAGQVPEVSYEALEQEVIDLSRTWDDRLTATLQSVHGVGPDVVERWASALPDYYKSSTSLLVASGDLLRLESMVEADTKLAVGIQNDDQEEALTRLAVYGRDARMELSTILPVLEALGLRIVEEKKTKVKEKSGPIYIHDFGVLNRDGSPLDVEGSGPRIVDLVLAVLQGEAESDSLDRLVVSSNLTYRQVGILRAYRTYWSRVVPGFTVRYVNDTFAAHPNTAQRLVRLFETRFNPAGGEPETQAIEDEILEGLDRITSLDEDRILRSFYQLIMATVRTSAFRPDAESLSFKFYSALVPGMPQPVPLYEIFVYTRDVEGVHLRGGMVARGGLRWSTRREDYRAEVLGLMKAQMTKNTVIVPTGAKGGFVLRTIPEDGSDLRDVVKSGYITFVKGLLDLTDNLVDGRIVPPPNVRRHDGDDPYFVVAADKGTAAMSDTANAIAAEYGFWLGDAFASGGSAGYDHKALAITARGAWESVKRHFADLGTDATRQIISVAGIGDMSGDVFGNGLLQSQNFKLLAAFDHRDIFLDPDPHPHLSYEERRRLFEMPRSSWQDYDRSLISEGGGVYSRQAKKIDLSPQVREALKIEADALTPDELIRAVLVAPVDLLWNGGVGTYVKASTETHIECDDRTNDAVRVDGVDLRCWVVGEGGNLGFTQAGRIEFARKGGAINTDFIDNSGGVDCSDREVNLKILLSLAIERGELAAEERTDLIEKMTEGVVKRVLYDNFEQAQILSQEVATSAGHLEAYEDLMKTLERHKLLSRKLEGLPKLDELEDRSRDGEGLYRPELAVLLAYAKQDLTFAVVESDIPDQPDVMGVLRDYFPELAVERFGHLLWEHPLRREIVATVIANRVINDQGVTFVNRLQMETGSTRAEVVKAYRVAHSLVDAQHRWSEIERLDASSDPAIQRQLLEAIDELVEAITRWFLAQPERMPRLDDLDGARSAFRDLEASLPALVPEEKRTDLEREIMRLVAVGVPEQIAVRHVYHQELVLAPDIIQVASATGWDVNKVAELFLVVGDRYRIDWLQRQAERLVPGNRWQRWAIRSFESDLERLRRDLSEWIMASGDGMSPAEAVDSYVAQRAERHERLDRFLDMLKHDGGSDLDSLMVAARQVRALAR